MHDDLTTQLSNYRKQCENRALKANQLAVQIASETVPANWPDGVRERDKRATAAKAEAAKWEERRRVASDGFLLVDSADSCFMLDPSIQPLLGEAARNHRVRYVQQTTGRRTGLLPEQR
jgi:hypothetical protein